MGQRLRALATVVVAGSALAATACNSTSSATTETTNTTAAPAAATTTAPTTAAVTTTAAATTMAPTTEGLALPPEAQLAQGSEVFGVYLKVIEESESSGDLRDDFAEVSAAVEALGYQSPSFGELGCDAGAQEGLGLGEGSYFRTAVYFTNMEDAETFATIWGEAIAGIATVSTFCLD